MFYHKQHYKRISKDICRRFIPKTDNFLYLPIEFHIFNIDKIMGFRFPTIKIESLV